MWWLYIHAVQLVTLWASFSVMPHYTVAFKPLFEFIVLGAIPGTDFEIGYMTSLIIAVSVLLLILLRKQVTHIKDFSIQRQNQVQA